MNHATCRPVNSQPGSSKIDQQAFDAFLACLDSDRNRAGEAYERLRQSLLRRFAESPEADRWADEALDRAIRKNAGEPVRNVNAFVFAIASRVRIEMLRSGRRKVALDDVESLPQMCTTNPEQDAEKGEQLAWLKTHCDSLPDSEREFLVCWYADTGRDRITHRKRLAARLGVAESTLRVRAFRHRRALQDLGAKFGFAAASAA